jgi:hypothetical protein
LNLDPEMFQIRVQDGLRLIVPNHGAAVANAPWDWDKLQYRSRVETLDGLTVSQGFKKFFNLGSGPEELQVSFEDIAYACEDGDAIATLKMDGSLLIRSVHEGQVMLRTRGSFGYEHLENAYEMEIFRAKYPDLFDPTLAPTVSLLLEWTSPANTIVLKYPDPELTLIGGVLHRNLSYLRMQELETLSIVFRTPVVESFELNAAGWEKLNAELETRQDIEGYVVRLRDQQFLVKVKCAPYLTKHALKSSLTTEKLADMYFQQGRPDFRTFCETFKSSFDEETCMWALGAISSLYDGVRELEGIEAHMKEKVASRVNWSRKEAALAGLAEYGQTKRFSLYMNLWDHKAPKGDLVKSVLLQNTKQVELGMFKKGGVDEGA